MAGPRGYSTYHGKGPKWKIVLAVLLLLVILGALAVIRLQKYVVYDDSGRPRLDLSRFSEQKPDDSGSAPADGSGDANLTIQVPERQSIQAVQLPVGPLTDWKAVWTAASADGTYNAAVYTVKDADGSVYVDSQAAAPAEAVKTAEGTAPAVGDMLKDSGVYTIAKIACFRDSIASSGDLEGMGLRNTGGYIFYDGNNDRWLDPGKPAARQYLIDLATGCAAAGFDEILLTDVSYPTVGKLNKIDYDAANGQPDSLKQELDSFLTELKTALAKYDVKLSILFPPELLASGSDVNSVSGQSLTEIAPLMDRVYAPTKGSQETLDQAEANLAAVSKTTEFVSVLHPAEVLSKGSYLITP